MKYKKDNLEALSKEYIGRAIVIGKTNENIPFVTYILTGRSDSSKARILKFDERYGVTYTEPTDRAVLERGSPVLLLYPAIASIDEGKIVVSNGAQTKLILNQLMRSKGANSSRSVLENSLGESFFEYDPKLGLIDITSFEPDEPNYTPRISGCVIWENISLAIARRGEDDKIEKEYNEFLLNAKSFGESKLIMTYNGVDTGKNPLNSFAGEPLDLRLTGKTEEDIAHKVRDAINPKTFIAVATQLALRGRKPCIINSNGGN